MQIVFYIWTALSRAVRVLKNTYKSFLFWKITIMELIWMLGFFSNFPLKKLQWSDAFGCYNFSQIITWKNYNDQIYLDVVIFLHFFTAKITKKGVSLGIQLESSGCKTEALTIRPWEIHGLWNEIQENLTSCLCFRPFWLLRQKNYNTQMNLIVVIFSGNNLRKILKPK